MERVAWRDGKASLDRDDVAVEEPLELRLNGKAISVTLRTPGDDEALAVGFLWGEGILGSRGELISVEQAAENAVNVQVAGAVLERGGWQRNFYATSSCGVCGKASLSMIRAPGGVVAASAPLRPERLLPLPAKARAIQEVFARTGGLHAAAWVDPEGEPRCLREDVGRHNAVDKVVGQALLDDKLPLGGQLLFVSGRAGFELVQKAIAAGFAALLAVGAPSSLAISLAQERSLGLAGFLRADGMNVYAHPERFGLKGAS